MQLVAGLALAAPAQGATIAAPNGQVTFTAEAGEVNDLSVVRREEDRHLVFRDEGATLHVVEGSLCTTVDEHTVDCALPLGSEIHARLGDGADRGTGPIMFHGEDGDDTLSGPSLEGGPGDDVLTIEREGVGGTASGGPGDDRLTGTDFDDFLSGGPGADELRAGGGFDQLHDDGGHDPDVYVGGEGVDGISYGSREDGITVDLLAEFARSSGEEDRLEGVENAFGGSGPDVLLGTDGPGTLDGGRGNDVIDGRGGRDAVFGNAGDDRVAGGAGPDDVSGFLGNDVVDGGEDDDFVDGGSQNDTVLGGGGNDRLEDTAGVDLLDTGDGDDEVQAFDRFRDQVRCGSGRDSGEADAGDVLDPSCEAIIRRPVPTLLEDHVLRGGRRVVPVDGRLARLTPLCGPYGCHGRITLRVGRRVVARGRWDCNEARESGCLQPISLRRSLLVPSWVARLLNRKGHVRASALLLPDGGLAAPERILLVRRRNS